ncbi:hypothetical protein ABPG75_005509 [Micractinium tetrahymenae]
MTSSRSSGQEGSTTSSGRESSLGSRPAPPRPPPPRPLDAARQQRTLAAAVTVRQQFSVLLAEHFDAAEALGDSIGGGMSEAPPTPRSGKASKGAERRYRGVTRHKRTQRFESHIWEMKKQIYLGGFDTEPLAAKAHDVMALRCKDLGQGEGANVLNFPRSDYAPLLPLMEKLSREDVITCLRNYSKGQTSKRMGTAAPSPRPRPSGPSATSGGVRKPSSGQAAIMRRLPTVATPAVAGVGPLRPLAVRLVGAPRPKPAAAAGASYSLASSASPKSGFGGKVAPRGRAPPGAAAAAATAAKPPSPLKQRLNGSLPPRSPPSPPLGAEPLTPHGGQGDMPAPSSPVAAAASAAAAGGRGSLLGSACSPLGGLRWQPSISSVCSAAAIGTYLGPAPTGSAAAAAASGQVLSVGAADCHLQYLSGLYSRYSQQPPVAAPQQAPPQPGSAALQHELSWCAAGAQAAAAAAAAAAGMEGSGSGTSVEPACAALAGSRPSSFGDLMDVEAAAPGPDKLSEEPSLTFSASDDAYLFAPTPAQGGGALEHVNGTVLFSVRAEGSAGSASHGVSACCGGTTEEPGCSLLPDWPEPAVPLQPSALWAASEQVQEAQRVQRQQQEAQAALAAAIAAAERPLSPGFQVAVLPAVSVPAPPYCSAAAEPWPVESAAGSEAMAAMLCQQLQLAAAQSHPSLCLGPSPFASYPAGSLASAAAGLGPNACLL